MVSAGLRGALEIAADEVAAPGEARRVTGCEHAVWKAAAQPQAIGVADLRRKLQGVDRSEVHVCNAAGQRLGSLTHQLDRGGAEQEEVARALSRGSPLVDDAAERFEQRWRAVNLVDNDELPGLCS
jgi:hypothetical protein